MEIKDIVIVGGGSSGWMTASAIAYKCPKINLTLIESPNVPNIGVGESTLGHINGFFRMMNMKDEDWMPSCKATYKNSIQFTDFYKKNTRFQYPFGGYYQIPSKEYNGNYDAMIEGVHEWFILQSVFPDEISFEDFSRYWNFNGLLAEYNRQTNLNIEGFDFIGGTAYHLDADLLGQYLKNRFCKNITHIFDDVKEIKCNDKGITEIISNNHILKADLYIDCTGFKSMLLEKTLGIEFENFSYLANDSAVNARIPYENDDQTLIANVTDCKALSSGWLWNIPLWHRRGQGYVYSSNFLTKDQAEQEFRLETKWDGDVNHLKFRHGVHKKAWYKNVLAIGLSYGFIEPLESTGLLTVHENIIKLITILKKHDNHVNMIDKQMFNDSAYKQIFGLSTFVSLHYGLSRRYDTEYWKFVTEEMVYDKFEGDIIVRSENHSSTLSEILSFNSFNYDHHGPTFILAGMRTNPVFNDTLLIDYGISPESMSSKKDAIKQHINRKIQLVRSLPTSYQFLKKHIYDKY